MDWNCWSFHDSYRSNNGNKRMYIMILCDIDGTLMTDEGIIPQEIFGVLNALLSQGISFVVASGRQINNLYALFEPCAKDLYYIAQNGAIIAHGREILYEKRMKANTVKNCLAFARQNSLYTMLYTNNMVFVETKNSDFLSFLNRHQVEHKVCSNLDDYSDKTYKLSCFKMDGGIAGLKKVFSIKGVNAFLVNDHMIDITDKFTDKGKAVRYLKKLVGVRKNEILAFGDSENDLALFAEARNSFAVGNAPKEVQDKATCVIPSNNENGVIVTLKKLFDLN